MIEHAPDIVGIGSVVQQTTKLTQKISQKIGSVRQGGSVRDASLYEILYTSENECFD